MVITINLKISIMNENINVRDADDMNDEYDDGEWMERIQQPECHDAYIPIVNHNTAIYAHMYSTLIIKALMQMT